MTHHTRVLICAFENVDHVLKIKRSPGGTSRFLFYESEDLAAQAQEPAGSCLFQASPLPFAAVPPAQPGLPL